LTLLGIVAIKIVSNDVGEREGGGGRRRRKETHKVSLCYRHHNFVQNLKYQIEGEKKKESREESLKKV
jgi:hypothetical protein